jgi:hypothetical protein
VNTADYTALRRLEETVRAAAEQRGFSHFDLFADAPLGTLREELIALDLYVELSPRVRRLESDLVHKMCRAAVISGRWNERRHCAPMTAPKAAEHPAIARANRAAAARRAPQRGPRT